jgi:formylglycine-generating enzyme required for sulfatase activity
MAGNVWEWTSDIYDKDENAYVLKGGSWNLPAEFARCAGRDYNFPVVRYDFVGFRCARTLK